MNTFTMEDYERLAAAYREIQEMKQFVIKRATIYLQMQPKPVRLHQGQGFEVEVRDYQLFDKDSDVITVVQRDSYYNDYGQEHKIPRSFIYEENNETAQKWEDYLALKAELEPKKN